MNYLVFELVVFDFVSFYKPVKFKIHPLKVSYNGSLQFLIFLNVQGKAILWNSQDKD